MARFVVIACPWVLWEELPAKTIGDVADPSRRWRTVDSYSTLKECKQDVAKLFAEIVKQGREPGSTPVCLPDTVDPRPPAPKRER
jgi:hypothetical protein